MMNSLKRLCVSIFLLGLWTVCSCFIHGAIPADERSALIALYNSTNGDGWVYKDGWKTPPLHTDGFAMPGTEGNWRGVTLLSDHVSEISLNSNYLIGNIPSQLGNLTNLKVLNLDANQLNGSIPSQLGNLINLQKLYLSINSLTDIIPSTLGNLTNLREIRLFDNKLSGSIPSTLGNLTNLQELYLETNQLTGSIPSTLGNLTNLQVLWLNSNQLSGSIPSTLGNLTNLRELWLNSNQLSGDIPSQLGNLSNLTKLYLFDNKLSGSIPGQLGNMSKLQSLGLFKNQLSGSIPSTLGDLTNLMYLNLNSNSLSGSIPSQLEKLINLNCLDLHSNRLTGSIPPELGNIINLWELNLYSNQLSGSIPQELFDRSKIFYLYLNNNKLSGSIPLNIMNLKIEELNIEYNCLSTTDSALRSWLNLYNYGWESLQHACGSGNTRPTVSTSFVSYITNKSALCGGNVTWEGDSSVTARGVCWSTNLDPTIEDSRTTDRSGTGSYQSSLTSLSPNTTYHVRAYATNSIGTAYGSDVSFKTLGSPQISLNHASLNFGAIASGNSPNPQPVRISNSGIGTINWTATSNANWLSVTPSSGTGDSTVSVSVNPSSLSVGSYTGTITVTDVNASNSPQRISVTLNVYKQENTSAPIGDIETPTDGSPVSSSIPVTGWAIDDLGIANVKIYNGNNYIGDATFIEGARPDVEAAYPGYPNNTKAGWGYMLLTHFLPNGGNGSYTLIAKATDIEGNEVTLGSKTITVDNAHATKPFGAIDSPSQGDTISGSSYVNFGWVLTPQPNTVPSDGSTIDVVIDGVVQGHAGYNQLRSDISSLFPGYNNSNGAGGYYFIDTTKLANGLHTIAWNVTDNNGNSDGIGSRYFSVMNTGTTSDPALFSTSPVSTGSNTLQSITSMNECNEEKIEIKELERLEIRFAELPNAPTHNLNGYLVIQNQLRECPVGSTLDKDNGIFYWQPGPGFVGEYLFVFTGQDENGQNVQKNIIVNIKPKY